MPSHNIPALTLLAGSPSLMSTLGCSTSCLALPPGHSSVKSDPRTTPSLISFLADSFSSQSTHSHSLSREEQLAQQLWTWASYTAEWTKKGKEFGKGQTRCPDLPSWTSSQTLHLPCLMLLNGSGFDPWPDPVGLHPTAEGAAHAVVVFILQPVHRCDGTTSSCCALAALSWAGCVFSFGTHMTPGEPETSSVPASASPAFLLIDRRERRLSPSKLFPCFKRVIFSDKKNTF